MTDHHDVDRVLAALDPDAQPQRCVSPAACRETVELIERLHARITAMADALAAARVIVAEDRYAMLVGTEAHGVQCPTESEAADIAEYDRILAKIDAALAHPPLPAQAERRFPIHPCDREINRDVPWSLVAAHEHQAQINHGQSLERLAERGGLSLSELVAVLEGRRWQKMETRAAAERVRTLAAEFEASRKRREG